MTEHLDDILGWQFLAPQVDLARTLYGEGSTHLSQWLQKQLSFIDEPDFAKLFTAHLNFEGIAALDYTHRFVQTKRGELLGGIRFYRLDATKPFVEVIAHNFDDYQDLMDCVVHEWRAFNPLALRVTVAAHASLHPSAFIDQTVHGARYCDMGAPDFRVRLGTFKSNEDALALVNARYEVVAKDDPDLARHFSPASFEELIECQQTAGLFAIETGPVAAPTQVGLLGVQPADIDWLSGDVVIEEVINADHRGQNYAASAQKALAYQRHGADAQTLMLGTIDRLNHASRKSALRAGRPEILRKVFCPLNGANPKVF